MMVSPGTPPPPKSHESLLYPRGRRQHKSPGSLLCGTVSGLRFGYRAPHPFGLSPRPSYRFPGPALRIGGLHLAPRRPIVFFDRTGSEPAPSLKRHALHAPKGACEDAGGTMRLGKRDALFHHPPGPHWTPLRAPSPPPAAASPSTPKTPTSWPSFRERLNPRRLLGPVGYPSGAAVDSLRFTEAQRQASGLRPSLSRRPFSERHQMLRNAP